MNFKELNFKGSYLVKFESHEDIRGSFFRNYCKKEIKKVTKFDLVQANLSVNHTKFTLRGFHYQKKKFAEPKLFFPVVGSIHNVFIDLRRNSKTYLKHLVINVDSRKKEGIYIPKGFANAFLTTSKLTIIQYFMGNYYSQENYKGFRYNDEFFNIKWPKKPKLISDKDQNFEPFSPDNL